MEKRFIGVEEKVPFNMLLPLSLQHMFAMFGASVLVPSIFGINPAIVLFMNGVGTLMFIFITKGKAPAYLGSSFAFLATGSAIIANPDLGYAYACGAFAAVGFVGCILAFIIKKTGTGWINAILPPAAMGPVVALIGLELAGSAASTGGIVGDAIEPRNVIVFLITLLVAVFGQILFRGFLSIIPILVAIIVGYISAVVAGLVDFTAIAGAGWFQVPNFQPAKFDMQAILMMLPVLLVITSEHVGHQIVTSKIIGKDLLKEPGLAKTIFCDNFSTMVSGLVGAVPTTTYGENIGVMAMTRVFSVQVIGGAAVISILCSFIGKLSALIMTIPGPVIGGISFLLYGMIGTSGLRILVDEKVDYGKARNLALTSVVFVTGLSGATLTIGAVSLSGMVLAACVAVLLSIAFALLDKAGLTNGN